MLALDKEDEELSVELAKLQLEDARQRLQRYESAAPSGAVSTSEVDQARNALSVAQIELAQAELAYTRRMLLAPFDGVIGIPQVDPGDRVTESTAIATLDDLSNLLVDFKIPEAYAYAIDKGQEVEAQTWALPGMDFTGTVTSLGSQIDEETRTLQVRARLPNEQGQLRTGMSFVMELPLSGELYPAVPAVAVQWDREAAYVWRVRDGQAERQTVEVVKRSEGWALLSAQLTGDDRVVVEGMQSLREGMPVEVRQRQNNTADLTNPETAGNQNDG
ncbi:efflux RND transporter periplasmic adaptor subunit [Fodinicurvata halophila]|uniref:efflux RND transporter periplasmic adaptor subunit n=1 Tax=Fodinicurvata halophila TaxID=1419723 RepID=UPI003630C987